MMTSLRPGTVLVRTLARVAKGLAELAEGLDQSLGLGEEPLGVIPGRFGELDRGERHRGRRRLNLRLSCRIPIRAIAQDRKPEAGADRVAAPLLVEEEGDAGLFQGEEIPLDRVRGATQLPCQGW